MVVDTEFENVIQRLAEKAAARARAGARTFELTVSSERHARYGGQLAIGLWGALEAAGLVCSVRQWTGPGHSAVLEVAVEPF